MDLALFSLASLGMGFGVGQWRGISESDLLLFVGNIALRAFWMFLMAVVLVTRANMPTSNTSGSIQYFS